MLNLDNGPVQNLDAPTPEPRIPSDPYNSEQPVKHLATSTSGVTILPNNLVTENNRQSHDFDEVSIEERSRPVT